MSSSGKQPGVMLYFDLRPCLQRLTNEQRGVLFTAILDYAESGILPELVDVAVGVAWDFVKPRIDRDAEAYAGKVEKARAAINKRWATQANTDVNGGIRENTDVYGRIPTTTTSSTTTTTSTSNGVTPLDAAPPSTPPVIALPLNDGAEYSILQDQFKEWESLYPAVDVMQQLRNMRGWLLSNPDKRKTRRGIARFITGWLSKEQDRGGSRANAQSPAPSERNYDVLKILGGGTR